MRELDSSVIPDLTRGSTMENNSTPEMFPFPPKNIHKKYNANAVFLCEGRELLFCGGN